MEQHYVYFYGSTRLITGPNSLKEESVRKRNQIIGFDGIDVNPELIEFGEKCLEMGETGTMFPAKNITIVPFRYFYREDLITTHLEDVIVANERFIKAESIGFPLMMLKSATSDGYNYLGHGTDLPLTRDREMGFKNNWCCFGHYYLHLLKRALFNKGYSCFGVLANNLFHNLRNEEFSKEDGTRVLIHADAGL